MMATTELDGILPGDLANDVFTTFTYTSEPLGIFGRVISLLVMLIIPAAVMSFQYETGILVWAFVMCVFVHLWFMEPSSNHIWTDNSGVWTNIGGSSGIKWRDVGDVYTYEKDKEVSIQHRFTGITKFSVSVDNYREVANHIRHVHDLKVRMQKI